MGDDLMSMLNQLIQEIENALRLMEMNAKPRSPTPLNYYGWGWVQDGNTLGVRYNSGGRG